MHRDERTPKTTDRKRRRRAYERPAVVDFGDAETLTRNISNPDYV